jgi:hypothetical protein
MVITIVVQKNEAMVELRHRRVSSNLRAADGLGHVGIGMPAGRDQPVSQGTQHKFIMKFVREVKPSTVTGDGV